MTTYAEVETALARMHGADAEVQRGAFRGRIKHLQRLGLPLGSKPGKGRRIEYTDEQIWQFALALELAELGLDPAIIVRLITNRWNTFFAGPMLEDGTSIIDGELLVISSSFMAQSWMPVGSTMEGLDHMFWLDRNYPAEKITNDKLRGSLVIDTGRMMEQIRDHLHDLKGE